MVATATSVASVDIVEMAGSTPVLQMGENLGRALARRVLGGRDSKSHEIGRRVARCRGLCDWNTVDRPHPARHQSPRSCQRQYRPGVQILARSNLERNVSTLHRAGADFVLSYAAVGATGLFNLLKRSDVLLVAEGLHAFRLPTPASLQGRSLAESYIRRDTGCNVIAVFDGGAMDSNPAPNRTLPHGPELLLIGDAESEKRFHDVFV